MSGMFNKNKEKKQEEEQERKLTDGDITGAFKGIMAKVEEMSSDVSALSTMVLSQNKSVEQIMRIVKDLPEFKEAKVTIKAQTITVRQDQFDELLSVLDDWNIDYEQLDFKK